MSPCIGFPSLPLLFDSFFHYHHFLFKCRRYSHIIIKLTCTVMITKHLSARQLILHRISRSVVMYVCMYVSCLGMQFKRRAHYTTHTDSGPFSCGWQTSGIDKEGDKERRRCLATLRRQNVFPSAIWQLK